MPTIDPTFYRSPGDAVAAAPEPLAYAGRVDPTSQQKDALPVVDLRPRVHNLRRRGRLDRATNVR